MLFQVENMSCQHCVNAVRRALHALDPAAQVHVDLAKKQVQANGNFSAEQVITVLNEEEYPATQLSEA